MFGNIKLIEEDKNTTWHVKLYFEHEHTHTHENYSGIPKWFRFFIDKINPKDKFLETALQK